VAYLNAHYDELAAIFPEMSDLDESVRWLSVFTWLEAARARGLPVPDLDALLALELPAIPTPRRFPQLLSYDVLPPPGASRPRRRAGSHAGRRGALVARAPRTGGRFPQHAVSGAPLAQLDRRIPDQAALAKEMESADAGRDAVALDLLSFRAERLLMHTRVLATLPPERRAEVEARRAAAPATRVFSIGIGGVDLGTGAIVAKASERGSKLGLGTSPAARPVPGPARTESVLLLTRGGSAGAALRRSGPSTAWVPSHFEPVPKVGQGHGTIVARHRPGSLVRKGTWKVEDGHAVAWEEWVLGLEGP
jgi:hypothetical protein